MSFPVMRLVSKNKSLKTEKFLDRLKGLKVDDLLDEAGKKGVEALAAATPKQTGKTAASWDYKVTRHGNGSSADVEWTNSNINKNVNIALIIQYGHGTGFGGYVPGIDYINPALKPVYEEFTDRLGAKVTEE